MQFHEGFVDPGEDTPFGPWMKAAPPINTRSRIFASSNQPSVHDHKHPTFLVDSIRDPARDKENSRGPAIFGSFDRTFSPQAGLNAPRSHAADPPPSVRRTTPLP
ncbi:hypothetical protein Salat_1126400 [Sesamum alatum]|uniref:Uncharacterized protein n=1 Tax=Sesamum alatum TaxID=300844 RepID=A0AAE2CN30_9LAMI|nr:hypothetical protein Salat_1126400 [Sesamum alatum]